MSALDDAFADVADAAAVLERYRTLCRRLGAGIATGTVAALVGSASGTVVPGLALALIVVGGLAAAITTIVLITVVTAANEKDHNKRSHHPEDTLRAAQRRRDRLLLGGTK